MNGGSTSKLPPSSSLESTCSELVLVPCMFVYAEFSLVHKFYASCHSSFYMFPVIPFSVQCQMSAQNFFSFPLTFGVGKLDQLIGLWCYKNFIILKIWHRSFIIFPMEMPTYMLFCQRSRTFFLFLLPNLWIDIARVNLAVTLLWRVTHFQALLYLSAVVAITVVGEMVQNSQRF